MRETAQGREDRLAKAAAGRNRGEGAPARRASEARTKPVRMTVDMPPPMHRRLKAWTSWAAGQLDVADVPAAEVVRILVEIVSKASDEPGFDPEFHGLLQRRLLAELRNRQ